MGATATSAKEMINNVWGELQEKPRYGGTITVRGINEIGEWGLDSYFTWAGSMASGAVELLGVTNWATPREVESLKSWWSADQYRGALAQGWETRTVGLRSFTSAVEFAGIIFLRQRARVSS